ncbi:MAG TPA: NADH-quinone oxidoreductase subunit L, partial [Cellulomonas sp.]
LTAFYMSRLFFMTFEGEKRWSARLDGSHQHPHEAPKLMTIPMIVLAVGSVAIGFVLQLGGGLTGWLEPVTGRVEAEASSPVLPVWLLVTLTLALVIAGVVLAWRQYATAPVPLTPPRASVLTRAARVDLYQDEVNDALLVEPGQHLTRSLVYGDAQVVDGAFAGLAKLTVGLGSIVRKFQTGYARTYAATMLVGVVVLAVIVLAPRI